jgi:hypothetical protein
MLTATATSPATVTAIAIQNVASSSIAAKYRCTRGGKGSRPKAIKIQLRKQSNGGTAAGRSSGSRVLDFMNQYGPLGGRSETVELQGSVNPAGNIAGRRAVRYSIAKMHGTR